VKIDEMRAWKNHVVKQLAEALIAAGALAVEMRALAQDVALTVHPHPALSETVEEAAQALLGSATHVFAQKK
jgi:dihydrolipoamide dehydrogenase